MSDVTSPFPLVGGYEVVGWVRARARELGERAVGPLENVAQHGSVPLRATAMLALMEVAPEHAESSVLTYAEHDPEPEVREAATRALATGRSEASLRFLCATADERPARIALVARLAQDTTEQLFIRVETAAERAASVSLEVLAERNAATPALVVDVLRRRPTLLTGRAASHLGNAVRANADDVLTAIARADEADTSARAVLAMHASPERVFDLLGTSTGPFAAAMLAAVWEQVDDAWTNPQGFDDGDGPVAALPDRRWRDVVAAQEAPARDDELIAAFDWASGPRTLRADRVIESGAEEGVAFAVVGFDVSHIQSPISEPTLHRIDHQCAGYSCAQVSLLGVPLHSPALFEALTPDSNAVAMLLHDGRDPTPADLAETHALLRRYVPRLPVLRGGFEAIVWTDPLADPATLRDAVTGLSVARILPTFRPWREVTGFWAGLPDVFRQAGPFDEAHARSLVEVGRRRGLGAPRIFLLWANSD